MSKQKRKSLASDHPYKRIKEVARRYGYKCISNVKKWDCGRFEAFDWHIGIVILVDLKEASVSEWNPMTKEWDQQ